MLSLQTPAPIGARRGVSSLALASLLAFIGCADPGVYTAQSSGIVAGGAATAYGLQVSSASAVLQFSLAGSGSPAPAATLSLASSFEPSAIAVDRSSGVVYVGGVQHVANGTVPQVLAFANGASTPARTITVQNADFDQPLAMTVDASGQLYVASVVNTLTPSIAVFAPTATGAATPVRTLAGGSTGLYLPTALAVDSSGNLYVSNVDPVVTPYAGLIVVFAPGLQGNTPPTRSISNIGKILNGVAVDSRGNIWTVQETDNNGAISAPALVSFAPSAAGAATPVQTIAGAATLLGNVGEIQLDSKDNIYVVEQSPSGADALLGFGPNAKGNVAPDLQLTPPALTAGSAHFAIR